MKGEAGLLFNIRIVLDSVTFLTIISLFNLGFFGGFSHCIGMCGPFVLTQVTNKLAKTPLEEYQGLKKLQNLALLPYHFGRITTYCFIGFCCSFLARNLADFIIFKKISAFLLFIAAMIFFGLILKNFKISDFLKKKISQISFLSKLNWRKNQNISTNKSSTILENFLYKLKSKIKKLFANPKGLNGYFLGIILGFIPCGLLYAAFILSATIANPFYAAFAMFIFGIATVPALFSSAIFSGFFFCKIIKPKLQSVANLILLINALALLLMALNLILY